MISMTGIYDQTQTRVEQVFLCQCSSRTLFASAVYRQQGEGPLNESSPKSSHPCTRLSEQSRRNPERAALPERKLCVWPRKYVPSRETSGDREQRGSKRGPSSSFGRWRAAARALGTSNGGTLGRSTGKDHELEIAPEVPRSSQLARFSDTAGYLGKLALDLQ